MDFEKKLQNELDKLPYRKHVDDGQYNDGQIDGFEAGARWALALLSVSGSFSADEVDELLSTQRTNCVVAVMKYITDDEILEKIAKAPMYDYKSPN